MALQICTRCQKRRIKCDLQLPACKNCSVAGVECFFWDDALGKGISNSYLHSLQQRKLRLQHEIQATDRSCPSDLENSAGSAQFPEGGYHLNVLDHGDLSLSSETAYIGPGSSARLLNRLATSMISWHLSNELTIPERLLPVETSPSIDAQQPSFPIVQDQRRFELQSLVTPATQRTIIEHYVKIISPEYTLLPAERDTATLVHENPLRWGNSNKTHPDALALSIVFAVSTTLITRDLDSNLSSMSMRCQEDVQRIPQAVVSLEDSIEKMRWTCTALCALALCEMISQASGQLWDLLGRAISTLEDLREGYQQRSMEVDSNFLRLERALLKLESSVSLHLRRPSPFCAARLAPPFTDPPRPEALADELDVLRLLDNISDHFTAVPRTSPDILESLLLLPMEIDAITPMINIHSATLYLSFHPLFTTSEMHSSGPLDSQSSRLLHIVAHSATVVISHFAKLNDENRVISVWMAAERVLEAGLVWAYYLMHQRRTAATVGHTFSSLSTRAAVSPILKVCTLLASFTARWKNGLAYMESWEIFVELLWNMV